ncbi:hypothetical protein UNSWDHB_582 [Dehalobacter sp. UNSWDHB]|nr:hypothetical protein UNSWDHB_582 [Dehalobacter sp. UNSWDHB]
MIIELIDFIEQANKIDKKLERYTDDMSAKLGITKELLTAQIAKMVAKTDV